MDFDHLSIFLIYQIRSTLLYDATQTETLTMTDESNYGKKLSFVALAIIVYYAADGSLKEMHGDSTITLQFIDISIHRPWVIFALVWISLGWFFLQFSLDLSNDYRSWMAIAYRDYLIRRGRKYLESTLIENQNDTEGDVIFSGLHEVKYVKKSPFHGTGWIAEISWKTRESENSGKRTSLMIHGPLRFPHFIFWLPFNRQEFRFAGLPLVLFTIATLLGLYSLFGWLIMVGVC